MNGRGGFRPARRSAAALALTTLLSPAAGWAQTTAPGVAETAVQPPGAALRGFAPASVALERDLERRFDESLRAANLKTWMERLAARPHHVGSPWGKANAEFLADLFRSWGYDTRIEEYRVLFPVPKVRRLEMTAPTRFVARLTEPPVPGDRTSGQSAEQLPTYNAYSADGDVEAELVYVNFGLPRDYEELARRGVDVRGKIVLARYGASWRGIKPKVAAENGAIGCLIYSDPAGDGYAAGEPYPGGGFRPDDGVQRGSVADMPLFPGDPLTPGIAARGDAVRLDLRSAPTLTKIPTLPIAWSDAQPLLRALRGPVAVESWRGALPVTYRLGPGPARVRLRLSFDWRQEPVYNVIATLAGAERPDQWIVRGNHHDAWVNGATDPVSGLVAMLEEARGIGELARAGHRPKRSIVYAAWDGEEPGLIGSTEWVEDHEAELRQKAVVYINSDSYSRGFFEAAGSHSLERFVNQVASEIEDPRRAVSVAARLRAKIAVDGDDREREEAASRPDLRLPALGSGSDYTPFLQHAGVASLSLEFGGEGHYGQYHSIYDSIDHFQRFMDPGYAYGVVQAKTAGRAVLRLANADVLPFEFGAVVDSIRLYAGEVKSLADSMRKQTAERNRLIRDRTLFVAADPDEAFVAPIEKPEVPHLNFAPLDNAIERLEHAVAGHRAAWEARGGDLSGLEPARQEEIDRALIGMERGLTREEGLPGRPWFRHQIYAPGRYTGYGVKTLPAAREAIEQRQYADAEVQIAVIAETIGRYSEALDRVAALLR